jgi:hypothetical protein
MNLDRYIEDHIDPEPDYLYRLYRATNIHLLHGRMASGHLQGRLLKMLVKMIRPKNILEVGTFSGYSAISMAEGLEDDGRLYTFEINDEQEIFSEDEAAPGETEKTVSGRGQNVDLSWLAYEIVSINIPLVHSHQPGGCNPQMDLLLQSHLCDEPDPENDTDTEPES